MFVNLQGKKVAIYTLGCKVNQYESDCIIDRLSSIGCIAVGFDDIADIYIINTCAVTNIAERKSRQIIHRAKKRNPQAVIVAMGCYVQAAKEKVEEDLSVDIVVGNNRKKDIARILDEYYGKNDIGDNFIDINSTNEYESMDLIKPREHCRAYVKVQDGCNNFCSYCIIPYTRGRIRSRALSDVLHEVRTLSQNGIKEVVITGINLSCYRDEDGNELLDLLQAVSTIEGIYRVRMGSLEPGIITESFMEGIYKNSKICPHFHLSLQSACNDTLKRMNRHYTIEEFEDKCRLIRSYYDRPALTTDIIVGFPGETEAEFEITRQNLERINLYEMHIFKYSVRNGTLAAKMPDQVPDSIKEQRSNILLEMAARHKEEYEASFKGETVPVLVEEYEYKGDRYLFNGHTDRYILVSREAGEQECRRSVNEIINVKI